MDKKNSAKLAKKNEMGQEISTVVNQIGDKKNTIPWCEISKTDISTTTGHSFMPKTKSEINQEKKQRRNEKIVAAIGDGFSSLANLFFASNGAPVTGGKQPSLLRSTIDRHNAEDKRFQSAYEKWQSMEEKKKEKEAKDAEKMAKEAEKNRTVRLGDGIEIFENRWKNSNYIDYIYEKIFGDDQVANNSSIVERIDNIRYRGGWVDDGKVDPYWDKKYEDRFKGKTGTYLKRDVLELILAGEGFATDDEIEYVKNKLLTIDDQWLPLK